MTLDQLHALKAGDRLFLWNECSSTYKENNGQVFEFVRLDPGNEWSAECRHPAFGSDPVWWDGRYLTKHNEISFYYESDGGPRVKSFYVIARHDDWPDDLRMDFNTQSVAREASRRLQSGKWDMESVAKETGEKWL